MKIKKQLLVLGLVFLFLRLPYLKLPLDRDEGGYAYVGWIWSAHLGTPYISVFDQKPPLTYIPYVIASRLLGNSYQSVRVVAFVYTLLLVLSFGTLAYKLLAVKPAFVGSLLFTIYISAIGIEGSNFNTEMLLLLPLVICFALYSRRNMFLSAFFGGLAILFKPVAAFPLAFLMVYELIRYRNLKAILTFGVGSFLPVFLAGWYFYAIGALPKLINYLFYFNSQYIQSGLVAEYICGSKYFSVGCLVIWSLRAPLVVLPLIIVGFGICFRFWRTKSAALWLGAILFIGNWLAIKNTGSKDFAHYFLLLVPGLSLLVGYWYERRLKVGRQQQARYLVVLLVAWLVLIEGSLHLASAKKIQAAQFGSQANWMADAVSVAEWAKTNLRSGQNLLVWGNEPEIYFYSKSLAPGGFMHLYAFSYLPRLFQPWTKYLQDYPPTYIVTYVDDPASYVDLEKLFQVLPKYTKMNTLGRFVIFKLQNI